MVPSESPQAKDHVMPSLKRAFHPIAHSMLLLAGVSLAASCSTAPNPWPNAQFSWQQPEARILPTGNREWTPKPFVYEHGTSVRYIDFDSGDDTRDGMTRQTAWKHHPWDIAAAANAKACRGVQTYVFKRGVAYRGAMMGAGSGTPGNPIRLTSDPSWGSGDAMVLGSTQIKGGWKKANAAEAPGIPDPDKVWYIDLGVNYDSDSNTYGEDFTAKFSAMWQVNGGKVDRLNIARFPNYDLSDPNNPVKNWLVWTGYQPAAGFTNGGTFTAPELKGLGPKGLLDGAVIWTETSFLMAAPHKVSPKNYDPVAGTVQFSEKGRPDWRRIPNKHVHFMIENVAQFLDSPGEYFFATQGPKAGRLFLRAPADADPNTAVYEVAQNRFPLYLRDQHDVVVSGLRFSFNDPDDGDYDDTPDQIRASACVRIVGNCSDITVKNCKFYNVADAVAAFPRPGPDVRSDGASSPAVGTYEQYSHGIGPFANDVMDNIFVTDNDIQHVERAYALYLAGAGAKTADAPYGKLLHVEVLRNRVVDTGFRPDWFFTSSIPAVSVEDAQTAEIAGNIVNTSWGQGIYTRGGKESGERNVVPLTRILVHDNQIDNTMLACNDYGGLEHFQGGPVYLYNNITRNCVGNRVPGHELGYSLYLDGAFKAYSFNNIIAGRVDPKDPAYHNNCGYFMVFGFMNQLFDNTIYHFEYGMDGSSGNRSNVLGNVLADCTKTFIGEERPGDVVMTGDMARKGPVGIPTMAYADNVFFGHPQGNHSANDAFGYVAGVSGQGRGTAGGGAPVYGGKTLNELKTNLEAQKARLATIGWIAPKMPLADPAHEDYRPSPAASASVKQRGVKYFVPWALARTVGEWNFYKSASTPQTVLGEGFYMTDEYMDRGMYFFIPRNDLTVSECTVNDYVPGCLEDWIDGALAFDGQRVATLSQAELTQNMEYRAGRGARITYDGSKRETVDMAANNFLIETVFKTAPGHTGGVLASKVSGAGYELAVGDSGTVRLTLRAGNATATVNGTVKVNDGQWHHVLVEVDRAAGKASIYVDGKPAGEGRLDGIAKDASLANNADFAVGKGFVGAMDFLRVCRSTLAESKTSIGELYAWEFDGPALRDFFGHKPAGKRDAGAIGLAR
jgi:hypothetical protein